jgi:transcriptional regulator with XRE-family HTH domain
MTPQGFKAFRKVMGWTQAKAAEALGLSRGTIENYEKGTRAAGKPSPIPHTVELACAALYHNLGEVNFEAVANRIRKASGADH